LKGNFEGKRARMSEIYLCGDLPALGRGAPANGEKNFASDPAHLRGCTRGGGHGSKGDTNRFGKAQPELLDPPAYDLERRSKRCSIALSGTWLHRPRSRRLFGPPLTS